MFKKYLKIFVLVLSVFLQFGFDYSNNTIPLNEIVSGGPPKDGIPALSDPKFITAEQADYFEPQERVLGLYVNNEARAYPLNILNWHELINDVVGGKEVVISYCPLCGTGMAFESNVNGKRLLFGTSGLLYNSNILFYDKGAEGLWSQIKMEAITGEMAGVQLKQLPLAHTTWVAWKAKYPDTRVLSEQTGHLKNYGFDPYSDYARTNDIVVPVSHKDERLEYKEWVVGVIVDGKPKAYSFSKLKELKGPLKDKVGETEIVVSFEPDNYSAAVRDKDGYIIPSTQAYWFAWAAFYPTTQLYY